MLLVFDIGNTQIKMGVFKGEQLINSWRMTTATQKTTDEYGSTIGMMLQMAHIDIEQIHSVVISSVVPHIMHYFCNAVRRYIGCEPLVIGPGIKTGIAIKTENPKEVGADLIADVAAACKLYGSPCLVVDFGTATKFEVINEKGEPCFETRFAGMKGMEGGLAAAMDSSGLWGFTNEKGELVVACQYEDAFSFSDDLAAVKYAGKWGYINRYGTMVIEPQFAQAFPFLEGRALVTDELGNYRILELMYYSQTK